MTRSRLGVKSVEARGWSELVSLTACVGVGRKSIVHWDGKLPLRLISSSLTIAFAFLAEPGDAVIDV